MFEETKQGLNLKIMDQDDQPMFADGSKVPFERTRLLFSGSRCCCAPRRSGSACVGHTSTG